jgi:S-adenosylmethionine:tRNA ribosyltransferase-isomerase
LNFDGTPAAIWAGLARHGRPVQYAHVPEPLALWDVWTAIAGPPVAFEPPSAGFALDWRALALMRTRGMAFATLTHAAGLSSTGDDELDKRLPFDEPYRIPAATAAAIRQAQARGGRVVAVGTTVVRALETAVRPDGRIVAAHGWTDLVVTPERPPRAVDGLLTGWHEPGASHLHLLDGVGGRDLVARSYDAALARGYLWHEFGDVHLILP